jgi:hypothetical protein
MNPVEYLWDWLKRHALANYRHNKTERTAYERTQQAHKVLKSALR